MLKVKDLKKYFEIKAGIFGSGGTVHAVDTINFEIKRKETFGLVGESGCGKTTTGLTVLGLLKPTSGEVYFEEKSIFKLEKDELRKTRRKMQLVFQDPFTSLNPRMNVYNLIKEPLDNFKVKKDRKITVLELMRVVGLEPKHMYRYPHEFSGGQRQRIAIARALAVGPEFLVADEPVSAIDVSVRAQILNLMGDLKEKLGLTMLFISHDLSVVKHMCDRIAVMYLGKIVELRKTKDLFNDPKHPYTQALISAIPIPNPTIKRSRIILKGSVPTPINPPKGCRFHPRCSHEDPKCGEIKPEIVYVGPREEGCYVTCHRYKDSKI